MSTLQADAKRRIAPPQPWSSALSLLGVSSFLGRTLFDSKYDSSFITARAPLLEYNLTTASYGLRRAQLHPFTFPDVRQHRILLEPAEVISTKERVQIFAQWSSLRPKRFRDITSCFCFPFFVFFRRLLGTFTFHFFHLMSKADKTL